MKIVTFEEFKAFPEGTIYSHVNAKNGEIMYADGLYRKGRAVGLPGDFFELMLKAFIDDSTDQPIAIMSREEFRWSLGDRIMMFAVYEADDLEILRDAIGPAPAETSQPVTLHAENVALKAALEQYLKFFDHFCDSCGQPMRPHEAATCPACVKFLKVVVPGRG